MLFGFRAKSNDVLDKFLLDFEFPPGTISRITSLWIYGSVNIYRLENDVIIFNTNGLLEFLGFRVFITSIFSYCIGLVLGLGFVRSLSIPFILVSLLFFFPPYHVRQTISKLKRYGYSDSINILDYVSCKSRLDYATGNL